MLATGVAVYIVVAAIVVLCVCYVGARADRRDAEYARVRATRKQKGLIGGGRD